MGIAYSSIAGPVYILLGVPTTSGSYFQVLVGVLNSLPDSE